MSPQSLSGYLDKRNKTCLPLLIAFSSLSETKTTLPNFYRARPAGSAQK